MDEQRYIMINDESGHAYIIKAEQRDQFEDELYADDGGDAFNATFGTCRLGWHPNSYTFTDPRDPSGKGWDDED